MFCNKCNTQVPEGTKFCPTCGNSLVTFDNNSQVNFSQTNGSFNQNVPLNAQFNQTTETGNFTGQVVEKEDKASIGLAILSWFIPLAGLIIFFVKKKTSPKTAKVSGICALISFILSLLVCIAIASIAVGTVNEILDRAEDQSEIIYEEIESDSDNDYDDDDDNVSSNTNVNASSDWKTYQVVVGEKTIVLPVTYTELSTATGFTLKDKDLTGSLDAGYYATLNMYKNDKLALYIEVLNSTGGSIKYTDSKVTRVSQTKYQVSQGATAIIFPGGIKAGDTITEEKIITLFGTPDDTNEYNGDNYESKTYTYLSDTTWTTINNFKIDVVNGVIDQISLDHRR